MKKLKLAIFAVATVFLAGLTTPVLADQAQTMRDVKAAYVSAFSGMASALEAQQIYSVARSEKNEDVMYTAAADMLASLSEARYWMVILDQRVTASDFSADIDKDVAQISQIVAKAHDEMDDAILTGNLKTITAAMDKAAQDYNKLFASINKVRDRLFPPDK